MGEAIQVVVFLVVAAIVIGLFIRKGKQIMRGDQPKA